MGTASPRQAQILQKSEARQLAAMIYHRLTLPRAKAKLDKLADMPHQPTQMIPLESIGGD